MIKSKKEKRLRLIKIFEERQMQLKESYLDREKKNLKSICGAIKESLYQMLKPRFFFSILFLVIDY